MCVRLTFRSSSWQTQQGETRYENAVTISNIAPFGLGVTEGSESWKVSKFQSFKVSLRGFLFDGNDSIFIYIIYNIY